MKRIAMALCLVSSVALAFSSTNESPLRVQPLSSTVRRQFHLDPFYQKCILLQGFPIVASSNTSDYAMLEAGWIIREMVRHRPELLPALASNQVRCAVMAYNQFTTDIPEHRQLRPKVYWDRRARGLGSTPEAPAVSCAEENLLGYPNDPYFQENILVHEFAHAIHEMGMNRLDQTFDVRLREAFESAMAKKLWEKTYAASNRQEYWAEGSQSWFDNNRSNDSLHNDINTRVKLRTYDPKLAALCEEVYGDRPWRYRKPSDRPEAERTHLKGFNPEKAPHFQWREVKVGPAPKVLIQTTEGELEVELAGEKAPVTVRNFLTYAQAGYYSDGLFHRTVREDNQPGQGVKIAVIQAGMDPKKLSKALPPIPIETTQKTGLRHQDGTLSMARDTRQRAARILYLCGRSA